MIIADGEGHYRFITQPDHARLAGRFAEHWGNETFERPEPFAAMVLAADAHDDGWWEYDRRPHLEDGEVVDFLSVPADAWVAFYDGGIESVIELNDYAGLVTSMHGSGLRRRRYGLSSSWPDTPPAFEEFVDREERRQTRLAEELHGREADGEHGNERRSNADTRLSDADIDLLTALHEEGEPPEGTESRLWCNYELLQVWDFLSLVLCTSEWPEETTIDSVPTSPETADVSMTVTPLGDDEFRLDPYPFDEAPLTASVPARIVPDGGYDDEAALLRAYYGGEHETVEFTLRE
ncbi:hypothetical protein ZOD2009_17383 [Haladaptatus paucihalophilus DX253]|uniref:DUF3891 domain-containing protein n=1 Tax=Haladaptatus paucihalophilus DX253 TaxID=797209 RepID=E7QXD8_HALPU|nr:DUF3891 family protein [Haladaptatus paucihalophilus]EFW90941.1 hypothetical protein ZOD2009_17383 [Haladaptatus paucihalophilus DX253]SHK26847.1 Protein of unknown function [Haladaptatus paucihalophilus DX253]